MKVAALNDQSFENTSQSSSKSNNNFITRKPLLNTPKKFSITPNNTSCNKFEFPTTPQYTKNMSLCTTSVSQKIDKKSDIELQKNTTTLLSEQKILKYTKLDKLNLLVSPRVEKQLLINKKSNQNLDLNYVKQKSNEITPKTLTSGDKSQTEIQNIEYMNNVKNLQNEIVILKKELQQARKEIQIKNILIQKLTEQNKQQSKDLQLTSELKQTKAKYQELCKVLEFNNKNIKDLQQMNRIIQNTNTQLKNKSDALLKQLQICNKSIMQYKQTYEVNQQEIYSLRKNISYLKLKLLVIEGKNYTEKVDKDQLVRLETRNRNLIKINKQLRGNINKMIITNKKCSTNDEFFYELSPQK